ncbi:hypothetical protein AAC387_Pa01g4449 [Persea americana]
MPRKVSYGVDYGEDYDDIYDDYDYDSDVEVDGRTCQAGHAVIKPGLWRCSICTYDNDESLPSCDICGVLCDPSVNVSSNGDTHAVDDKCKDSGASVMAKSLFASLPRRTPKMAIKIQQLSDDFQCRETNSPYRIGNIRENLNDYQKGFMTPHYNRRIDIAAPFKFDRPSPDDLVSAGKHSSRLISKAETAQLAPYRVPSSTSEKKSIAKVMPNATESSSSLPITGTHNQNQRKSSAVSNDKLGAPTSKLRNLTLDTKTESSKTTTDTRTTSCPQYKPEPWMLSDKENDSFSQLSLAVGHVDSGKSTLSGRLLHLLGRITQKEMHKYEKDAREKGKGSFAYAWALDESAEERERGVTMTVAVAFFDTQKYHVVVLDSPGHKDFVPNMISGATQADAAVLVVDASVGSFEAGMEGNGGGQTKEHSQLIRSFGVEQIIVAVNKMDVVSYSQERFDFIKTQLSPFLRSCGFKESSVTWIPLSAIENQNLVTAASNIHLSSWYQGPYLLDAIDSLKPPVRDISKPLRMPICDVIKFHSSGQVAATGKLEAGAIRNGIKVLVMPSGDSATVRSISMEQDSRTCSVARTGDNVSVSLQGIDGSCLMTGGVLCHPDFPVAIAICLELKVLVLDVSMPILVGSQVEFHVHHAKEAARVIKILSVIDQKTGKVSKRAPRCLIAKQSAVIEVALDRAVCVEEFSVCKGLGRIFLRASGKTVAVGITTRIVEQD